MGIEPKVISESEPISEITKVTTITNPVGQKNVGGTQINPATEDTLASVKIAVEAAPYKSTTPAFYNVTLTNANTEYSQALSANTKKFSVHLRDFSAFRFAYAAGKVATPTAPYLTVPAGGEMIEELIQPSSITLYFASSDAGKIAEIEEWV